LRSLACQFKYDGILWRSAGRDRLVNEAKQQHVWREMAKENLLHQREFLPRPRFALHGLNRGSRGLGFAEPIQETIRKQDYGFWKKYHGFIDFLQCSAMLR
jgi:hypothetical protein